MSKTGTKKRKNYPRAERRAILRTTLKIIEEGGTRRDMVSRLRRRFLNPMDREIFTTMLDEFGPRV